MNTIRAEKGGVARKKWGGKVSRCDSFPFSLVLKKNSTHSNREEHAVFSHARSIDRTNAGALPSPASYWTRRDG
jgi:hypothetical protein